MAMIAAARSAPTVSAPSVTHSRPSGNACSTRGSCATIRARVDLPNPPAPTTAVVTPTVPASGRRTASISASERAGVIDVIGKEMLFATLPVAEETYLRWAIAVEPAQPTETPVQAIEDESADSSLPWQQPDSDDEPAEGRDPDRGP
jgi:hypothetical protein